MKEFKLSSKLTEGIQKLLNDGLNPMELGEQCLNYMDEDTTAYDAAMIGYNVADLAKGSIVYAVMELQQMPGSVFFFSGNPDAILRELKEEME